MDCNLPGSSVHGDSLRLEYWSGLLCPPPGDLLNPGIEPWSPALQADSLPSEPPGKPAGLMESCLMVQSFSFAGSRCSGEWLYKNVNNILNATELYT